MNTAVSFIGVIDIISLVCVPSGRQRAGPLHAEPKTREFALSSSRPYHQSDAAHAPIAASRNSGLVKKIADAVIAINSVCTRPLAIDPPVVKRQRVCCRGCSTAVA